ncbi:hypothetical protein TB147_02820 [Klebsiella aerogenes]|uniref:hypothetical protein n=1 Tax=Klebsiella aerogenes TaxID=548 RepID=UPI002E311244|nr:hypothetical protein [Klebsiella aerogenes]MED7790248.1 hypothetical protein [Klebsiella aerogenes]
MTKSTITRERLEKIKSWRETYGTGSNVMLPAEEAEALARIALAAIDSEPVAYTDERNLGYIDRGREAAYLWGKQNSEASDVALYRHAQPAPVVLKDHQIRELVNQLRDIAIEYHGTQQLRERIARVLRAAMLQAEPVTTANKLGNSPVIPDGYVMVPKVPTAEMISSGIAAHYDRSQIQIHDRPAPGPMECAYVAMLAAAPQEVRP